MGNSAIMQSRKAVSKNRRAVCRIAGGSTDCCCTTSDCLFYYRATLCNGGSCAVPYDVFVCANNGCFGTDIHSWALPNAEVGHSGTVTATGDSSTWRAMAVPGEIDAAGVDASYVRMAVGSSLTLTLDDSAVVALRAGGGEFRNLSLRGRIFSPSGNVHPTNIDINVLHNGASIAEAPTTATSTTFTDLTPLGVFTIPNGAIGLSVTLTVLNTGQAAGDGVDISFAGLLTPLVRPYMAGDVVRVGVGPQCFSIVDVTTRYYRSLQPPPPPPVPFETGWTPLPLMPPPAKLWHLSTLTGDNTHDGHSQQTAKRTFQSLENLVQPGDWILLDENGTWDRTVEQYPGMSYFLKNGASAAQPTVVTSYGPGHRMPVVRPYNDGFTSSGASMVNPQNILIQNIDFYGDYQGPEGNVTGVSVTGQVADGLRIEGCNFRNLFGGIKIEVDGTGGDVYIHRVSGDRQYLAQGGSQSGIPVFIYMNGVREHVTEVYSNYGGWNPDVPNALRADTRRAFYFQYHSQDTEFHRAIILRSGSEGAQMRIGGKASCIVCAECSGAGFTHYAGQGASGDYIKGLLQLGSVDLDASTPRGGGLEIEDGSGYYGGLLFSGRGLPMGTACVGASVKGTGTPWIDYSAFLDWQSGTGAGKSIQVYSDTPTIKLTNSDVSATGAGAVLVDIHQQAAGFFSPQSDHNRYNNATPGIAFYGPEGSQAFLAWQTHRTPADAHSSFAPIVYPSVNNVTFAAYMASIGALPTNQNLDGFNALAMTNRIGNWNPAYTAGAVFNFALAQLGKPGFLQSPPVGLRAIVGGGGVTLGWTGITGLIPLQGYGVAFYKVYKTADGGLTWTLLASTASTSTVDLAGNAATRYAVSAVDTEGYETNPSPAAP